MDRSVTGFTAAALLSLVGTAAQAADPGFYFAATGSRVEHDVEKQPGIRALTTPIVIIVLPPSFGPNPLPPPPVLEAIRSLAIEVDDVDAGFSLTAGYRINRYLAAELSYTDFGEYEMIHRYSNSALNVHYQLEVSGPSVSVLGSLPIGERWEFFLRGGVLFAEQEVSFKPGSNVLSQDFDDEVVMAGVGVQWSFAPRWATRLEYQSTGDLKYDNSGESSIDQASLSVLFKL